MKQYLARQSYYIFAMNMFDPVMYSSIMLVQGIRQEEVSMTHADSFSVIYSSRLYDFLKRR